jgi:Mg-chelatase subunit ChlD
VLPLTESKATVKNKINSLQTGGYTRIDIAAGWGWRTLSARWQGRWGTSGLPLADDDDPAKAIVIMSDGQNDIPNELPDTMENAMKAQADADLASTCAAMRGAGYEVFTVAFQAPADGEAALRACAASDDKYFASATAADLRRAFRQIAGRLSELRLAE